jgi:hypothetical protein
MILPARVKSGESPPIAFSDPALEERETRIYGNYQRAGGAQQVAAMISKLPEFPGMSKMLDMGG